jgi:hypothetical protein
MRIKPFAATEGAGGITTAAVAETIYTQRLTLVRKEPKYFLRLDIKLPFRCSI